MLISVLFTEIIGIRYEWQAKIVIDLQIILDTCNSLYLREVRYFLQTK